MKIIKIEYEFLEIPNNTEPIISLDLYIKTDEEEYHDNDSEFVEELKKFITDKLREEKQA